MDTILRLNEFFVEGGKQNLSHVLLHITEPSTPEEMRKGYFFALCEINEAEGASITKLQEMIDRAENEYYEIPTESKDPFELVLEKMNGESFVLEKVKNSLHCIIGAIRESEIVFSYSGKPHLLLFYKTKQGLYERMDLMKGGEDDSENNEQFFSQIVQGKLSPSDFLFAGTPHIIDFFSHDRLEKIITTRTAQQSAQHLEKVLGELKNGYSFGGLIINVSKPELTDDQPKKRPAVQGSSSGSLQTLYDREKSTADTLSPSLLPKLNKLKGILGPTPPVKTATNTVTVPHTATEINSVHVNARRPNQKEQQPNLQDYLVAFGKKAWTVIKFIGQLVLQFIILIWLFFYNIFRFTVLIFIIVTNYQNRRATIISNWKQSWRGFKENFKHLPIATKIMLFGSIFLAIAFFGSIFVIRYKQKVAADESSFNHTVEEIKNYETSIDGEIIYKRDDLTYLDYQKATALLQTLSCNTKVRKPICDSLKTEFEALGTRLKKISKVAATEVTSWQGLQNGTGLVKIKNKIIAFSGSTSTLFVYDILTSETKTLPTYQTISGFTEAAVPKENDYAIFLFNKNQLMQLNIEDLSLRLIDISYPVEKSEIAGLTIYNRRLYSLDTKNGEIFRHDPIKTGFGQGKNWLKDSSNVNNGADITIDSDVYVMKTNGEVAKFTSGISSQFTIGNLDPALTNPARIWTYADIPYLYILDPLQKRLVIFEKNGHLVGQLTSDSFKNPTGMVIDPANKVAFILDGSKLLKLSLPQ